MFIYHQRVEHYTTVIIMIKNKSGNGFVWSYLEISWLSLANFWAANLIYPRAKKLVNQSWSKDFFNCEKLASLKYPFSNKYCANIFMSGESSLTTTGSFGSVEGCLLVNAANKLILFGIPSVFSLRVLKSCSNCFRLFSSVAVSDSVCSSSVSEVVVFWEWPTASVKRTWRGFTLGRVWAWAWAWDIMSLWGVLRKRKGFRREKRAVEIGMVWIE